MSLYHQNDLFPPLRGRPFLCGVLSIKGGDSNAHPNADKVLRKGWRRRGGRRSICRDACPTGAGLPN